MSSRKNAITYLILSAIGATLVIIMAWLGPSNADTIDVSDKLIMGFVFISSCIFGISLAVRPRWLKKYTKRGIHGANNEKSDKTPRKRQGHHPDCEEFKSHTIRIGDKTYCAGCLGLSLGALVSILLMTLFIIPSELPKIVLYTFVILGIAIIALNYMEIMLPARNAHAHVISNIFLVIAFFFIVISTFQLTGSVTYGIIGVIISFLWLDTRIQISSWRHAAICKKCSETCKVY